jgi:hypothetical protein
MAAKKTEEKPDYWRPRVSRTLEFRIRAAAALAKQKPEPWLESLIDQHVPRGRTSKP